MLASIWSFLGWTEEPSPSPPPVTITGVRIPADGTPAHLLSLTTTSCSGSLDEFLFHVPDLRQYWNTEEGWKWHDLQRLDLLQDDHIPRSHYYRQKDALRRSLLISRHSRQQLLHLRQRYLLHQRYHVLHPQHSSCVGGYYLFYSSAFDELPENSSVPAWISDMGEGNRRRYFGDVFLVRIASHEYGENGWAAYEDIVPQFLGFLVEGPLKVSEEGCYRMNWSDYPQIGS